MSLSFLLLFLRLLSKRSKRKKEDKWTNGKMFFFFAVGLSLAKTLAAVAAEWAPEESIIDPQEAIFWNPSEISFGPWKSKIAKIDFWMSILEFQVENSGATTSTWSLLRFVATYNTTRAIRAIRIFLFLRFFSGPEKSIIDIRNFCNPSRRYSGHETQWLTFGPNHRFSTHKLQ